MGIFSAGSNISDTSGGFLENVSVDKLVIGTPTPAPVGANNGFASGGYPPSFATASNEINKFPFAQTSGTATDVGDLSTARGGQSSQSNIPGGTCFNVSGPTGYISQVNVIDKFPNVISSGTATDIGDVSVTRANSSGHESTTHGFTAGGSYYTNQYNTIDKFPFSQTSGVATDVGDIGPSPSSKYIHGTGATDDVGQNAFADGGYPNAPVQNTGIVKFPFAQTSGVASTVGSLSAWKYGHYNCYSQTESFAAAGYNPPSDTYTTSIHKYPFSISSGSSTDVGDLSSHFRYTGGMSGDNDGFAGGSQAGTPLAPVPTGRSLTIHKFPYSISSGTGTTIGSLAGTPRSSVAGNEG